MTATSSLPPMRASLRWLLAASVLLSALALWWPSDVSQAVARRADAANASMLAVQQVGPSVANTSLASASQPQHTVLPERLAAAALDKAQFNPFVGVQPLPPPQPKPLVGPVYEPPAPPPPPPAVNYRYLGRMTDPSGQQFVYLARGSDNKDTPVTVGTRLDEGYVVEAITADGVRLLYPPLGVRAVVAIPPAQQDSLLSSSSSSTSP